jgi:hypothetical protein
VKARLGVLVLGASLVLISTLGSSAYAEPPTKEREHFDVTVRLVRASNICGFDVFGHFEGNSQFIVFYDRSGAIDREVDTFPDSKITVFAPSTGKSYTSAGPAALHTQYTDGAAIGSSAIAELTGLVEKVDGVDMDSGRLVFNAVVVARDAAGVPLIRFLSVISSNGPDLDTTIGRARCNAVR